MQVQSYLLTQKHTIHVNQQLAERIIAARGEDDRYVKALCSEDFLIDPTTHLINEMIKRRVGMARIEDGAGAFVIGHIPGFLEKVSSPDYLRSFAANYFKNDPNRFKIMQIFEHSLSSPLFQNSLKSAIDVFNSSQEEGTYSRAENALRIPLTIYLQSKQLKEYTCPQDASVE